MNKTRRVFEEFFARAAKQLSYFVEKPILEFTESMTSRMAELKITNSELAEKLGCKPSYVTKVLRGSTNFTLESMVKIGLALDCELAPVRLVPKISADKLCDILSQSRKPEIDWLTKQKAFRHDTKPQIIKADIPYKEWSAAPHNENLRNWMVTLRVNFKNGTEVKIPYIGTVQCSGIFTVDAQWPEKEIEKLVMVNGTSLLYSAIREMVCNITARGPFIPLVLPSQSFLHEYMEKKRQMTAVAPATPPAASPAT